MLNAICEISSYFDTSDYDEQYIQNIQINMSNFQPLEVVDRGSETQLQVGENLNPMSWAYHIKRSIMRYCNIIQKSYLEQCS